MQESFVLKSTQQLIHNLTLYHKNENDISFSSPVCHYITQNNITFTQHEHTLQTHTNLFFPLSSSKSAHHNFVAAPEVECIQCLKWVEGWSVRNISILSVSVISVDENRCRDNAQISQSPNCYRTIITNHV